MSDMVTAIRRAKDTGDFSELVAAVPYWRFLGISAAVQATRPCGVVSASCPQPGHEQHAWFSASMQSLSPG